jgi:hypothetical protein
MCKAAVVGADQPGPGTVVAGLDDVAGSTTGTGLVVVAFALRDGDADPRPAAASSNTPTSAAME